MKQIITLCIALTISASIFGQGIRLDFIEKDGKVIINADNIDLSKQEIKVTKLKIAKIEALDSISFNGNGLGVKPEFLDNIIPIEMPALKMPITVVAFDKDKKKIGKKTFEAKVSEDPESKTPIVLPSYKPNKPSVTINTIKGRKDMFIRVIDLATMQNILLKRSYKDNGEVEKDEEVNFAKVGRSYAVLIKNVNPLYHEAITMDNKFVVFDHNDDALLKKFLGQSEADKGDGTTPAAEVAKKSIDNYVSLADELKKEVDRLSKEKILDNEALEEYKEQLSKSLEAQKFSTNTNVWIKEIMESEDTENLEKAMKAVEYFSTIMNLYSLDQFIGDLPLQIQNADALDTEISITTKGNPIAVKETYSNNIRGGFNIDVAPVIVYHWLRDRTYSLKDSILEGDTAQVVRPNEEGKELQGFGIGVLANMYSRTGTCTNVAASFGTVISADENPRIRFLAGANLIFGDKKYRFSLGGGSVFGPVKGLDSKYKIDDILRGIEADVTEADINDESVWKVSGYVSVGLNIALGKTTSNGKEEETK